MRTMSNLLHVYIVRLRLVREKNSPVRYWILHKTFFFFLVNFMPRSKYRMYNVNWFSARNLRLSFSVLQQEKKERKIHVNSRWIGNAAITDISYRGRNALINYIKIYIIFRINIFFFFLFHTHAIILFLSHFWIYIFFVGSLKRTIYRKFFISSKIKPEKVFKGFDPGNCIASFALRK